MELLRRIEALNANAEFAKKMLAGALVADVLTSTRSVHLGVAVARLDFAGTANAILAAEKTRVCFLYEEVQLYLVDDNVQRDNARRAFWAEMMKPLDERCGQVALGASACK